ncbi:LysR family transcriptional regulator [Massilia forsythiae]|uniref:LysR family transcriptional regulator n=1 Tax=Massilia forsythiae TaxID=2728020 RepID=A0A7Z2VVP0_9BURK|nr:LysR substrate-binding domain-containing protein [Massilia forsythiae]QJE00081.1 LysR family transcriptional regulator [Massilia forsythiae]
MRLRHIEVFHAIMQVGTISGAAQVLHISQPAVTKVLQHAELQLGMPLFERVRGKLYPKPEAHRLFAETEKLHRDLQGIRRLAASLKSRAGETVRLVSTPTLAISVLPAALTLWRRDFAETRCELATFHTTEIVNALRLGEADLALSLQDPRHPGIEAEPIAQGALTVMAPAGTWSAEECRTPLSAAELGGQFAGELIGLADGDPLGETVVAACEAQDVHPVFHTVVQTYQIARSLVEAGAGSAVLDPFTAASAAPDKVQCRPWAPAIPVQLYLLSASHAPLSHGARELANCIGAVARGLLEGCR